MTLFKKSTLLAALTAAGLFAIAERPVAANTVYYALTSDHCTNGCGGNGHLFGVITLTDIAGGNGVRFTLELADGSLLVDTGFPPGAPPDASIAFNLDLNPAPLVDQNATLTEGAPASTSLSLFNTSAASLGFNGFGTFEYALTCKQCGTGGGGGVAGPFTIDILAAGLTTDDFAQKSVGGDVQAYFAVDILSGVTGYTGLVDASGPSTPDNPFDSVPDGGTTVALLGSALLGIGMMRRRFGKG